LSMAQKQIAPTTQIIRIPIRSEIMAIPLLRPGPRRLCRANVTIWNCKIMSFVAERSLALTVHPMSCLSRHPSPRRPQFAPRAGAVTLCTYLDLPVPIRLTGADVLCLPAGTNDPQWS
jgi:hypothetical protein